MGFETYFNHCRLLKNHIILDRVPMGFETFYRLINVVFDGILDRVPMGFETSIHTPPLLFFLTF